MCIGKVYTLRTRNIFFKVFFFFLSRMWIVRWCMWLGELVGKEFHTPGTFNIVQYTRYLQARSLCRRIVGGKSNYHMFDEYFFLVITSFAFILWINKLGAVFFFFLQRFCDSMCMWTMSVYYITKWKVNIFSLHHIVKWVVLACNGNTLLCVSAFT